MKEEENLGKLRKLDTPLYRETHREGSWELTDSGLIDREPAWD